jgi:hypothetical protein
MHNAIVVLEAVDVSEAVVVLVRKDDGGGRVVVCAGMRAENDIINKKMLVIRVAISIEVWRN